tara:strand:+ start:1905 stop:2819 length:915 start_codon:yes stop_codon:yes gene_type:complete
MIEPAKVPVSQDSPEPETNPSMSDNQDQNPQHPKSEHVLPEEMIEPAKAPVSQDSPEPETNSNMSDNQDQIPQHPKSEHVPPEQECEAVNPNPPSDVSEADANPDMSDEESEHEKLSSPEPVTPEQTDDSANTAPPSETSANECITNPGKKARSAVQRPRGTTEAWWSIVGKSWLKALNEHKERCTIEAEKMDGGHIPKAEFARTNKLIAQTEKKLKEKNEQANKAREKALENRQKRSEKRKSEQPSDLNKKRKARIAKEISDEAMEKTKTKLAMILEHTKELMAQGVNPGTALDQAQMKFGSL